jgi:hypothetical protein
VPCNIFLSSTFAISQAVLERNNEATEGREEKEEDAKEEEEEEEEEEDKLTPDQEHSLKVTATAAGNIAAMPW